MATEGLNAHHQNEVKKFLKFFRSKLDLHAKGLDADFEDTLSDRLSSEDMYTQSEVASVIKSLASAVKSSVRSEFQTTINMTALLLRQMFLAAETEEVDLDFDTSSVEDKALLDKVQRMIVDDAQAVKEKQKVRKKYTSLKEEYQDLRLEMENLQKSNEQLKSRFQQVQEQCSKALKDKQTLREQLEDLQDKVESSGKGGDSTESSGTVRQLESELRKTKELLSEQEKLARESHDHISQSRQFQDLKKMLGTKNDQIRELRSRLSKYENDKDADDD